VSDHASKADSVERDGITRWECVCKAPPVLLGTQDSSGTIHVKVRDRYWHIVGLVKTACPRCGAEHVLASNAGKGTYHAFGFTRS
jgi:ribosomal protein S27AE